MIKVEHIQASICAATGQRIDTLILEYPRVVHAQLLTHRVFSKNSSSTRAIPLDKAIAQLEANPAEYIWTLNQAGMQGEVLPDMPIVDRVFGMAKDCMIGFAKLLNSKPDEGGLGIHKQNAGRLLEPFQNIKIVLTSTEWENWDWLRDDPAAQGEIAELARAISKARAEAEPMVLNEGEWHVPFVDRARNDFGSVVYYVNDHVLSTENAKLVSMSVCAQTSYRNADYSLEKAIDMRGKLLDSKKVHASPSEHQATPVPDLRLSGATVANGLSTLFTLPVGVTHLDRKGNAWSGNFCGWIRARQLLSNHDKAKS